MIYKELSLDEISDDMLDGFERDEEINKAWRIVSGEKVLKDIHYTEYWDKAELKKICKDLKKTVIDGGTVFGAFDNNNMVGFASLETTPFGSRKQYIQLAMLHITKKYRQKGIGRSLFLKCIEKAKYMGAEKIYISASSCENAQYFYTSMECVQAKEINTHLAKLEPYDIQLEFVL